MKFSKFILANILIQIENFCRIGILWYESWLHVFFNLNKLWHGSIVCDLAGFLLPYICYSFVLGVLGLHQSFLDSSTDLVLETKTYHLVSATAIHRPLLIFTFVIWKVYLGNQPGNLAQFYNLSLCWFIELSNSVDFEH